MILLLLLSLSCFISFFRSLTAWVDGEPSLLLSCCLVHPLRGCGIIDESRTETADRVAKVPDRLLIVIRSWLCQSYHKLLRLPWRICFCCASVCLLFLSALGLTLFICSMVSFSRSLYYSIVSATPPAGGARHFFLIIFPFSFDIFSRFFVSLVFSLCFDRMHTFSLVECIRCARRTPYLV